MNSVVDNLAYLIRQRNLYCLLFSLYVDLEQTFLCVKGCSIHTTNFTYQYQHINCIFLQFSQVVKARKHYVLAIGVLRKFSWRRFIQWHMVVICIWCALLVTSQFDVIFMFLNQRFGEVCWHYLHNLPQALSLFYALLHWIWTINAPS